MVLSLNTIKVAELQNILDMHVSKKTGLFKIPHDKSAKDKLETN